MPIFRLLLVICLLCGSYISSANSVLGGNITWNCLGGDQYEITLTYYQDCLGNLGTTATQDVFAYPTVCGGVPFSATLGLVSNVEISDLCATEFASSTCSGGVAPGTTQLVYTGVVTLDSGCTWDIIWNGGAWNYFVNTSVIPQDAYIHSIINTNLPCSNSTDIISTQADPQIPYVCFNLPASHPFIMSNPLGYTLSYSLVNALTTGPTINSPITASGYTSPLGIVINATTGVITWGNAGPPNITLLGNYLISVAITMTDSGGNNVGTIYENMVFVVRNCVPTVTNFTTPEVTSVGSDTALLTNTSVEVCAGDSLIFSVSATNSDITKAITLSFTPVGGLPGLVLTQTGINPANGRFSLLTTGAMAGTYIVNVHAVDNACPNPGTDDIAITVTVHPNVTLNLANTTICLGQSVNLVAAGLTGNNYTWAILPGGDNPSGLSGNGPNQTVIPDFTTSYSVTGAGIPAQCQASDVVVVNVSLSAISGVITNETCGNNNGAVDITISGNGSGIYTYDWADVAGTSNTEDRTALNGGVSYDVIVTDATYNCTINGSYAVGDIPQPTATFTGATTICDGACTNLTLDFTAGTGPFNFVISPVVAGLVITGVTDPYIFQVCPTANTTYTITSITDATNCTANVNLPQIVTVRPIITGVFSPEAPICAGSNLTLEVDYAGAPVGNYEVVYTTNNLNPTTATLADLGTINIGALNSTTTYDIESISYTNAPLCPSNDAANPPITVTVHPLPTVTLGAGGGICNGGSFNIPMSLTGTGPWTVSYTANNVAQTALVVNNTPFSWPVSPTATTQYCITAVTDANCTNTNNSALNQCVQVVVTSFPTVNYSINDTELCAGETATITVTVTQAGLWTANFTQTPNNAMPDQFTSQGSALVGNVAFTYNITPAVSTTYRLVDVYFDGVSQCATTVNQDILVNVNGNIAVQTTDTICNNIGTQYQVVYTVSGGELPYDEVVAAPNGTFNGAGTIFTSDLINSGSGGSWTFSDVNDCNSVVMTMAPYSCPVLTNAGTMNLTAINNCGTGAAVATWNNNGFLDGNDQQAFILHTTANNTLGTVVQTNCNAPSFSFVGGMTYGTTYYISSIAGDDIGDGNCVNTAAPNVQISPGTPVTWYETPTATLSAPSGPEACTGSCVTLNVAFTGTGPWTFVHRIGGVNQTAVTTNLNPYTFCVTTAGVYDLASVTSGPSNICTGTFSGSVTAVINTLIAVQSTDTICNNIGTQYQVVYTVSGGELPYDEVVAAPNGTFNGAGTIFTTDLINSGSGGSWTFSDVNDCNSVVMTMAPYNCPVLTNAGTMNLTAISTCGTGAAVATWNNNGFLDGNDQQAFILHTTANNTLGTVIATNCSAPSFSFGGAMVYGTTYYISSIAGDDIGDGDCVNTAAPNVQISPGTPVTWYETPTATLSAPSGPEACTGSCVTLSVAFTGTGAWTFTPRIGGVDQAAVTTNLNPYTFCVTTAGTYDIGAVSSGPNGACVGTFSGSVAVIINGNIAVQATDTICNNISTQYQVVYTVSGGELPYDEVVAAPNGTFNGAGTIFTSDLINSGSGGSWTFSDVNDCNSIVMTMAPYNCPILTNAGTMNVTAINTCGIGAANATWNNNGFLDGNDQQMFVLHTNSDNTLGTIIQTNCNAPSFSFIGGMTYGTTYYISSTAGDDLGDGNCVNTAAPNVQISPGTPVTWYETPTATLSAPSGASACSGSCVTLSVAFTGTGPWTFVHSIGGVNQPAITTNNNPYTFCVTVAGTYDIVSVTSGPNNFCSGTFSGSIPVVINPLPTATLSASASTCSGIDHCFTVNLTGTGPWSITVNDPSPINAVIPNINNGYQYCVGAAGAYQIVTVTDANTCTNTVASPIVSLTVNALPTVNWAFGDTSFCQGSSINLAVNLTGATPYQINLTSPDVDLVTPWNGSAAAINTAGTYTLNTVTDNNGCIGNSGASIDVTQIATPIANAGLDLDQCSGLSVTLGTAAQPNHTYSWSPTTGMTGGASTTAQPTVTITNSGSTDQVYNYTVTASVQQCSSTDQVQFTVHPLPSAAIVASDSVLCLNASTTLTASGGNSYTWQPSASITTGLNAASITATPLVDETFTVLVSQSYGALQCSSNASLLIEVGTALVVNKSFSQEVCFGTCNGFITLVGSGSFPPYSLDPTSDITSFNAIDLCPGVYDYIVVDDEGCTFTETITIDERAPEVIDQITITQPVCAYDLGSIQVVDNSTTFGINGCGINETNGTGFFDNLTPCLYTITTVFQVSANEFCVTDSLVTIAPISSPVDFNAVWTSDVFCFEEDACFEAQPTGGLGNLDVQWFDCAETIPACYVGNNNPLCIPMTENTTLWGYAVDQLGCLSDTVQVVATLSPAITLSVQNNVDTVEICENECATIDAVASGGVGNITIEWYQLPFDVQPFATGAQVNLCPFTNTNYYAVATDGCNESPADSLEIIVHSTPNVLIDVDTLEGCFPLAVTFYNLSAPFADDFDCSWNFGNGENYELCEDTLIYAYPGFGNFFPSLTLTSEYGCVGSDTLAVPIIIHGYPEINFSWEPQPVTVLDTKVEFTNLTQGGVSYNWNFYNAVTTPLTNPTHIFPMIDQGIFEVCLESTSQYGCIDTVCKDIFIESVLSVFVPNTFTPDEDGVNDVFLPVVNGEKFGSYIFRVFDRWGNEMFTSTTVGQAWTGNSMSGEYYVQNDVYLWRLEVESLQEGKIKVFEGTVTILR